MSCLLFFFFITVFKVNYINETEWNLIKKKIDFKNQNELDTKLCHYLKINCLESSGK